MTRRLVVGLGALGLVVLFWRVDLSVVKVALLHVGWGMALIVGQETVAHGLNALGWRFTLPPEAIRAVSFGELLRLRVAGDAINYLTPTATIGGEFVRTAMLGEARGAEVRVVSVIVAKFTQTLAQAFFVTVGLGFSATAWIVPRARSPLPAWALAAALLVTVLVACRVSRRRGCPSALAGAWHRACSSQVATFVRKHPRRVVLSTLMFALAYAWGAVEAYWICRFLGSAVSLPTAFAIEVLSITLDGILFMVPAKIGTQEVGKVAVFMTLGLPLSSGFAFGVVRHMRELVWAAVGMLLCGVALGTGARRSWRPTSTTPREPARWA